MSALWLSWEGFAEGVFFSPIPYLHGARLRGMIPRRRFTFSRLEEVQPPALYIASFTLPLHALSHGLSGVCLYFDFHDSSLFARSQYFSF